MFCSLQTAKPSRGLDDHFEYNWLWNKVDLFISFLFVYLLASFIYLKGKEVMLS